MLISLFLKSQKAFLLALEPLRQISADHNNNDGDQLNKHSFLIPPVDEKKSGVIVNNNNNNNNSINNNIINNQLFVERVTT